MTPTPSLMASTLTVSAANGVLANDTNADSGTLTAMLGGTTGQWQ